MSKIRTKPASMSWREWCRIEDERLGSMRGSKTALRELRELCKRKGVNISLKGLLTPKSLLESLAEAIAAYRAAAAANPAIAANMQQSTAFVDSAAADLARLVSMGKPLTEEESQRISNAITTVNEARYDIENKLEKRSGFAGLAFLAVVIGAGWYLARKLR